MNRLKFMDVQVDVGSPISGRTVSPDSEDVTRVEGARLQVPLDVYEVLLLAPAGE
jgi:hypothetical protein